MTYRRQWKGLQTTIVLTLFSALVPGAVAQNEATKLLVGNTKVTVLQKYSGEDKLQKPVQIVVHPFSISEDAITIDRSPVAHILGNGPIARLKGDAGKNSDPDAVANEIEQAFEKNLMKELGQIPISVAVADAAATTDSQVGELVVRGEFTAVQQGNETARMMEMESTMAEQNWLAPDAATTKELAEKAYIYAYPLVLLSQTESVMPVNHLTHVSVFPDASFRLIVRPNADTLYSTVWLDLSNEPILLHVPDSGGRFYLLQFMDAWTETFADPGKRTTGTAEKWFALTGPGWTGKLPDGVVRYEAPTNHVWLLGRTQTNGSSDYENVHAFQNGMRLVPLSQYPGGAAAAPSMPPNMQHAAGMPPPDRVKAMDGVQFFKVFAEEMKTDPPHPADAPVLQELARLGLAPGQDFDASRFNAEQLAALNAGVQAAKDRIESYVASGGTARPGWTSFQGVIGRYGTNYVARAATARVAIGANPAEDAVYMSSAADANGKPLNATSRYRMHFAADSLPPVQAFWSITAYDEDGYFIANPLNRFAIGDRDALKFNPDGSLDLYIQGETPGPDREANWLPVGTGQFNLTIRLYWPKQAVLSRAWHPPALERLQ